MSILIKTNEEDNLTAAELAALKKERQVKARKTRVIDNAIATSELIAFKLIDGLKAIWDYEDPQAVLDALGEDAVEAFALSRETAEFIIPRLTGKRDDIVAQINDAFTLVQPYTENEDGSVTID